ncbi:protein MIZU-KUSSEI 1 [Magnolia sinica]|uniref:protein MIZU-KUSSEI 1 n=1 Tax=Magnolia sinica TaxID=86752 RepID=UPI0026598A3F|nr:protein MIZU-KUSSEI 1 [Magnolia sinica]
MWGPIMAEPMPESEERDPPAKSIPPTPPSPPSLPRPMGSLLQPTHKKRPKSVKVFRLFRSVFRTFPIFTPACKLPTITGSVPENRRNMSGTRVTGTLFGYRKGRVSLSMQEAPKCLPTLVVELAMQTNVLQKEMSSGMVRIALECEKRSEKDKMKLLDEPMWTMYCNGKKSGYGVKREATEEDLSVMELLKPVSMGAGVLPGNSESEGPEGELAYMRAHFERVVGSKDSETLYMLSPDGSNGPELSIFFVRL